MSDLIKTERHDRVVLLRMNNTARKNALTQAMYAALAEAIEAAAPDAFTSGNDVQDFLKAGNFDNDGPTPRFMRALAGFPKPAVAAVNGAAIGIGVTMLLHCDLIYAGAGTRFQTPFVNIGICAEFASTYLLPLAIGNARAAELVLLGEPFTAATALEYGLINGVLPDGEVEAHALAKAHRLAQQPPNALRVNKKLLRHWAPAGVAAALKVEFEALGPLLRGPEAVEALTAFTQKRKPDFSRFE
jgi:enoyl-CoA hydratase/carnithine racemase